MAFAVENNVAENILSFGGNGSGSHANPSTIEFRVDGDNDLTTGAGLNGIIAMHIASGKGNVGIGTTVPTQNLDINGSIRLRDQLFDAANNSGVNGQVLIKTGGVALWESIPSVSPSITGTICSSSYNFPIATAVTLGASNNFNYTGTSITVPTGKWVITDSFLLGFGATLPAETSCWEHFTISHLPPVAAPGVFQTFPGITTDVIGSPLISGVVVSPSTFGLANGQIIVNSTSGGTRTYYLRTSLPTLGGTIGNLSMISPATSNWGGTTILCISHIISHEIGVMILV
ncbi:MAG: hypothetical protein NTW29_10690 [Bacteroidetes bacterium]|nr:hypothetical protein [Bacteroidota bacterium]